MQQSNTIAAMDAFAGLSKDQQILAWDEAKEALQQAKEIEAQMRQSIIADYFGSQVGTQNIELGNGYVLKGVIKQSYNLDKDTDVVDDALDQLPDYISDHIVKWTPRLNMTEYKKLQGKEKAIIDKVIEIKDSMPTLTLVEPKNK